LADEIFGGHLMKEFHERCDEVHCIDTMVTPTRGISSYDNVACQADSLAGKLSRAGNGGFILFFVHTEKRKDVMRPLNRFEGQVGNCHFTKHAVQAWRV
jgi:galactokinase/mevalonate kinase-like predicted kinase